MDPTPPQPPDQPAPPPQPDQPAVNWAPQPPATPGAFNFSDFINFRYLITPGFITVIYVIGAIFITIGALASAGSSGSGGVLAGLIVLIFGNLWWRIILEFVMVLFRINDSLVSIDRRGRGL